jgi:hypothetical protein
MRNAGINGLESTAVPLELAHKMLKLAGNCFLVCTSELMTIQKRPIYGRDLLCKAA